jgi:hypothetical protein
MTLRQGCRPLRPHRMAEASQYPHHSSSLGGKSSRCRLCSQRGSSTHWGTHPNTPRSATHWHCHTTRRGRAGRRGRRQYCSCPLGTALERRTQQDSTRLRGTERPPTSLTQQDSTRQPDRVPSNWGRPGQSCRRRYLRDRHCSRWSRLRCTSQPDTPSACSTCSQQDIGTPHCTSQSRTMTSWWRYLRKSQQGTVYKNLCVW